MVAGLKSSYAGKGGRCDLGSRPLLEWMDVQSVHWEEGFKASEGCIGVFQDTKDRAIQEVEQQEHGWRWECITL